eukprot:CAMPEP_0181317614 /NCGR_PEP_ID=MMETSP1101-20121128/16565_1 /TAXON_ID=46948 /ORGANISM="Rhodomonas abbreviata, Strain Caron Lab Isolate" /LENGTH=540 /DNA_ID=CAMNT_0023425025 /DNA_START=192 /DNA_END=1814 /DNA_ORIENTATION=+
MGERMSFRSHLQYWALCYITCFSASLVLGGQVIDIDGQASQKFQMNLTHPFHPSKSLSFAHVLFLGFDLSYADSAALQGYIAQDVAQLGRYYAKTKFGCITSCDSSDFNGIDGILGLGMPDAALASIPEPLFFAISDETGDPANQYILNRRIFTIVSTDTAAELHLGGYDPHAVSSEMKYVHTTSAAEYSVPVYSIAMNGEEVLNFASASQARGRRSMPGILDSGTSCLVVPDSTLGGLLLESPYSKLMSLMSQGSPIYVTIDTHQFEIPFKSWWLDPNSAPCIQRTPDGFEGVLLGDVLFRALVVMFDLSHPQSPVIGLAPRNPLYRLVETECSHVNDFKGCVDLDGGGGGRVTKMRMEKRRKGGGESGVRKAEEQLAWLQKKAMHRAGGRDVGFPDLSPSGGDKLLTKVPVDFYEQTQYFINVSLGTPRQVRTVILDTGSSVFAVFCDPPPKKGSGPRSHIYLPHFIPALFQTGSWALGRRVAGDEGVLGDDNVVGGIAILLLASTGFVVMLRWRRPANLHTDGGAVALHACVERSLA